jgi:hypothetical protein
MNTNKLAQAMCESLPEMRLSFLDKDNVLWMFHNGEWVGKKAERKDGKWQWK